MSIPEKRYGNPAPTSPPARVIGVIMPESAAAFRTQAKVGYRPFGTIGWVGLGPWRHHFMRIDAGARAPGSPPVPLDGIG